MSNATRSLALQTLLRKLGYHAVKASYHTLGKAVDLRYDSEAKQQFDDLLATVDTNTGKKGLELVDERYRQGEQPTLTHLVEWGIIPIVHKLWQAVDVLTSTANEYGLQVIDETPFAIRFTEKRTIRYLNPSLHLQFPL